MQRVSMLKNQLRCSKLQNKNNVNDKRTLPKKILVLGYGAVAQAFVEILLKNFKNINLLVCDANPLNKQDPRFKFITSKITRDNLADILKHVDKGDAVIDLSV